MCAENIHAVLHALLTDYEQGKSFSHIVCIYFISGCKLCTLLQHGIQIYESRLLCFLCKIGDALALRLAV